MRMYECPQCGSVKSWAFDEGEPASSIWDRFDKCSPDTGYCWKCKFRYYEHIDHPLDEQIEEFREDRKQKRLVKNVG